MVEEVFERLGWVWHLTAGGRLVRTTGEHPFHEATKGWVACQELSEGDRLVCEDGSTILVEEVVDTGEVEVVYNLRVTDWHTYFVGGQDWGFSVWAHNAYIVLHKYPAPDNRPEEAKHWAVEIIKDDGTSLFTHYDATSSPLIKGIDKLDTWIAWTPKGKVLVITSEGSESKEIQVTDQHANDAWKYVTLKLGEKESDYKFITNSCFTYVAKVLDKAGIPVPKSRNEASMRTLLKRLDEILRTGK